MREDLLYRNADELRDAMRTKQLSPVELMEETLRRLKQVQPAELFRDRKRCSMQEAKI